MVLKILCLHGYRQDGKILRERSGGFRKLLKGCDFTFIDAPHPIPLGEHNPENNPNWRAWWYSTPESMYFSKVPSDLAVGFDESLDHIRTVLTEQGPFDGILAFSQGASLTTVLLALMQSGGFKPTVKFAILVAPFKSHQSPHSFAYEKAIALPTLHIIGDNDQVIPRALSDELVKHYENATIIRHPGGHQIPAASSYRQQYLEFLEPFLKEANGIDSAKEINQSNGT